MSLLLTYIQNSLSKPPPHTPENLKESNGPIVHPRVVTDRALGHSVSSKHLLPTCNEFDAHERNGKMEMMSPGGENDLIFKSQVEWLCLKKISHHLNPLTHGMPLSCSCSVEN